MLPFSRVDPDSAESSSDPLLASLMRSKVLLTSSLVAARLIRKSGWFHRRKQKQKLEMNSFSTNVCLPSSFNWLLLVEWTTEDN
jgi:hypothetical protein